MNYFFIGWYFLRPRGSIYLEYNWSFNFTYVRCIVATSHNCNRTAYPLPLGRNRELCNFHLPSHVPCNTSPPFGHASHCVDSRPKSGRLLQCLDRFSGNKCELYLPKINNQVAIRPPALCKRYLVGLRAFKSPPIQNAFRVFKSPCICADGRIATTNKETRTRDFVFCRTCGTVDWKAI